MVAPGRAAGRYSKVSRRMWNDEKFRALSAPAPNAQTLFTRLLSGPELSNIPGLFSAWEAGLAQALRWPLEGFREAFAEVAGKGMAEADWDAGLVWVPNAIAYNRPESPNVVRSWRIVWDELPECALKRKAYEQLRTSLKGMGEAFRKAFDEACAHPSPNQEQEQEQEQEQDPTARAGAHMRTCVREGVTQRRSLPANKPSPPTTAPPAPPTPTTASAPTPAAAPAPTATPDVAPTPFAPEPIPDPMTRSTARTDSETTRDGVFGMSGEAFAEGIRAVTRAPFTRLSRVEQQDLQRLLEAHAGDRRGEALLAWVRTTATEYARSVEPRFAAGYRPRSCAQWLDAGRPRSNGPTLAIVQRAPATGRAWKPAVATTE
jgi:hypothetical protein